MPTKTSRKTVDTPEITDDDEVLTGAVVTELSNGDRARRVFRGVRLPDAPTFSLESASDPDWVETFEGLDSLPGLAVMKWMNDGISSETMPIFFQQVLGDEQYRRFEEFCLDPGNGINIDVLLDLSRYLLQEYTGRPTRRSAKR